MIENIDVGGPTLIRAAAKNHPVHRGGGLARELRRGARGAARERRPAVGPHAREPGARGVRATPPATTRRSRAGSPSARRTSPAQYTRSFEKVLDLPYGENPHQRAALYCRDRRAHAPALDGLEAPRQGAVVQQPARSRRGPAPGRRLRAAGRGDHQAQQPVRGGRRRGCGRGLRQGAGHRPPERVRRRLCASTARSTGRWPRSSTRCSSRSCSLPASTRTRSRCSRRSPTCGCSRTRSAAARR